MAKVLACIDGSVYSKSVADHAAWAAKRLEAAVEILQVIGRRAASSADRSGRIVAGSRRQLLEMLAELDAERAKVMHDKGWLELDEARQQIIDAGVADVTTALRHGDLLDTLADRDGDADLVVVGKRGEAADFATMHLGSNLERILRSSRRPVLVTSRAHKPIERVMFAFDGRPTAMKAIKAASESAIFKGLHCTVLAVAPEGTGPARDLAAAAAPLRAAGRTAEARRAPSARLYSRVPCSSAWPSTSAE